MRCKLIAGILLVLVIAVGIVSCIEYQSDEQGEEFCCKNDTDVCMSLNEAKKIASNSECAEMGSFKGSYTCNNKTGTWWIDLDPYEQKQGCNPACVLDVETKKAKINWRCTGLLTPTPGPDKSNSELQYTIETVSAECKSENGTSLVIKTENNSIVLIEPFEKGNPCYEVSGSVNLQDKKIVVNLNTRSTSDMCVQCIGEVVGKVTISNLSEGTYDVELQTPQRSITTSVTI